ncbi:MAG: hypothetical protein HQ521_01640 [Bacteroidetes bacterium]|nr:hypothetical protein [Bacteroidota bacterium]
MKYLTIIAVLFIVTSCCNHSSGQKDDKVVVHKAQSNAVTLVNGEKWKVNFATNKGIRNMKKLMANFKTDSQISDYQETGIILQKEFQHIFQRCDMTGEAHNQLHNYLHPMSGWFKTFKDGSLTECQSAAKALKEHLERYDSYFK